MVDKAKRDVIAQVMLDAFDADPDLFQGKLLEGLSRTETGLKVCEWARENPAQFEITVRALSALIKRYSNDLHDRGRIREAIADQLNHLPAEFHRAVSTD